MRLPKGASYLLLAGVVGLVATALIHRYIATKTVVLVKPSDQVVVATAEMEPGTALSSRLVSLATWPRELIPAHAIRSLDRLEGRVVQTHVSKGEPLLTTKLAPEGTAAGLGGLLKPGRLAVTVRIDEVSGVAGFIHPGDLVDVLAELPSPSGGEHFSKIILQSLKVLSKGQTTDQQGEKKPQVVTTATLEVTPEQAEILNLASFQGKIRLALRNQLSPEYYVTAGVMTSHLFRGRAAAAAAKEEAPAKPAPAAAKERRAIELIKGLKRQEAEI